MTSMMMTSMVTMRKFGNI